MNYLAHAYLSFGHPGILAGNMISDFVKGKKQYDYPPLVQHGIRLHRMIDSFTDAHPATREAKIYFKPVAGLYAGAFIDVVYDHFLALDPLQLDESGWESFAQLTYSQLAANTKLFPERFAAMFPYMRSQNWLYHYRFTSGIERSFEGLVRRARYLEHASPAFAIFIQHYEALRNCYVNFFPDVKIMAQLQMNELLKQ